MIKIYKKYGIYQKDNEIIAIMDIIIGCKYEDFEKEDYWKKNSFKADYSIETNKGRLAVYNEGGIYKYLISNEIVDPVVVYKSLTDSKGAKGMTLKELNEWELIK